MVEASAGAVYADVRNVLTRCQAQGRLSDRMRIEGRRAGDDAGGRVTVGMYQGGAVTIYLAVDVVALGEGRAEVTIAPPRSGHREVAASLEAWLTRGVSMC